MGRDARLGFILWWNFSSYYTTWHTVGAPKHCWIVSGLFPSHQYQWTEAAVSSFPQSLLWTTSSTRQALSVEHSLAFQKGPASTGMSSKPSRPLSQVVPLRSSQRYLLHLDALSGPPSAHHSLCPLEYKQPRLPSLLADTAAVCVCVLRHCTQASLEFLARVTVMAGSTFQLLPTLPPGPSLHQENCLLFYLWDHQLSLWDLWIETVTLLSETFPTASPPA